MMSIGSGWMKNDILVFVILPFIPKLCFNINNLLFLIKFFHIIQEYFLNFFITITVTGSFKILS